MNTNNEQLYERIMTSVAKQLKKTLTESYIEKDDFTHAAKWLSKYLSDNQTKICEYYQKNSNTGAIGYDALERIINTTCLKLEKEY